MKPRKSFPLRLSPDLYQALEVWAQQEMRSVNGQIEFLLKDAVGKRLGKPLDAESSGESFSPNSVQINHLAPGEYTGGDVGK
jgi:hypothetical protein